MHGLTEEQIVELHLKDEFEDVCIPSGGFVVAKDPLERRNGRGDALMIFLSCTYIITKFYFQLPIRK